jgi:hypothetical protein
LALATLKIITGEIGTTGVLTPELCLEPLPFIKEVAHNQLKTNEPGELLNEAWEIL